jgi:branched-chain amino acid transport system ATP-binding protein
MALFEAQKVHKRFGDHVVLEEINLGFEEHQLSGIMGPNGAGKTTCFNVLTGRYKPDRGRVVFDGIDISGKSPGAIAKMGISRSFQVMNVFDEYSALDNVLLAVPEVRRRGLHILYDLVNDSQSSGKVARIKEGITIVIIEHEMNFLFNLADVINVIQWGQVVAVGTPDELRANPWVQASNLGKLA